MLRRISAAMLGVILMAGSSYGNTLRWGEDLNFIYNVGGVGNDLPYSETDGTAGAFAQLIWAGVNGTADSLDIGIGNGTTSDDVVMQVNYSYGATVIGTKTNQFVMLSTGFGAAQDGSNYFVRVYNVGNPNWTGTSGTSAAVAGIGATAYWQSSLHSFAWDEFGLNDDFRFGEGSNQTLTPIPEPSTMLLFGLGALTLVARRAKRK